MALLPKPNEPLRILTIDGDGLKAESTILILDKLLDAIARHNGVPDSKPRPCDVFDVIAGTGPGGWLALLLGRFQIDVPSALAEWYNLIDCDTDQLVELIDGLTEFYETDKHMFFTPPEGTRCKHVFVSALKTGSKDKQPGYNLFRTYDCPKGANVLEELQKPRKCTISHAFEATRAAKYSAPRWRKAIAIIGISKNLDLQFQSPHNTTELAVDEMWGLYGKDVEISVVVNIGPGVPNDPDLEDIAKSFSCGTQDTRSPALDHNPPDGIPHDASGITHQIKCDQPSPGQAGDVGRRTPVTHQTTYGTERNVGVKDKLKTDESKIEPGITEKLRDVNPEHTPPYYRLIVE